MLEQAAGFKGVLVSQQEAEAIAQAANILNVSPTFLVELLEAGEIPHLEADGDRLIRFEDLMVYKEKRDKKRGQLLDKLIEVSQEAGFYEKSKKDRFPPPTRNPVKKKNRVS